MVFTCVRIVKSLGFEIRRYSLLFVVYLPLKIFVEKLFLCTVKDFFKSPSQVQSFVWVEIFLLSRNISSAVGTTEKGRKRTGLRRSGVTSSCSSPSFLINALSSLPLSLSLSLSLLFPFPPDLRFPTGLVYSSVLTHFHKIPKKDKKNISCPVGSRRRWLVDKCGSLMSSLQTSPFRPPSVPPLVLGRRRST